MRASHAHNCEQYFCNSVLCAKINKTAVPCRGQTKLGHSSYHSSVFVAENIAGSYSLWWIGLFKFLGRSEINASWFAYFAQRSSIANLSGGMCYNCVRFYFSSALV